MVENSTRQLQPLDLGQCRSVADIVEAMSHCSFGARMLGEVTAQITSWIIEHRPPIAIYEGQIHTALGQVLQEMLERGWLSKILSPQQYSEHLQLDQIDQTIIVIGAYAERYAAHLHQHPHTSIFINPFGMVNPQQIADGYYPNVVFSDPNFILPVIFVALQEKLEGKPRTVTYLIDLLENYDGLASEVHAGAKTVLAMIDDPNCTVFLTLSGAMTIAKMGLVICDMIEMGMVQGICSTGALMAHGLVESIGLNHLKYNPNYDDSTLAQERLNRVGDTLEPDSNFCLLKKVISSVFDHCDYKQAIGSREFNFIIGEHLSLYYPNQRGILKSAYQKNVPVFVPAFHDSELANDIFIQNFFREKQGKSPIIIDLEKDTKFLLKIILNTQKIGIFTIGGGVPRNYIQNIAPVIDYMNEVNLIDAPPKLFSYGCRICPDPMYYGHLSGCSYSEGMSWRKMEPNGVFSEIHTDATLVWPFLVKYVIEARQTSKLAS